MGDTVQYRNGRDQHTPTDGAASTEGELEATGLGAPEGFTLLEEVGRGGMGAVFRARDLALDREVAVKILKEKFAPDSPAAVRFLGEARITAQLQHPGVPAVYQIGRTAEGRPFLAMKLIKGETLASLLKTKAPIDLASVFENICQAVGYAHARGVIHRDLKPHNVMVGAFGEVQVMDWGLAKILGQRPQIGPAAEVDPDETALHSEIRPARDADDSLTEVGSVLGTPSYMAPEQAACEYDKVDARADVFGLGAILCAMLTGRPPFEGETVESVRLNAVRGRTDKAIERLDRSEADPALVSLCKRCLTFEPAHRPLDANVVAREVAALRRAAEERARLAELGQARAEIQTFELRKRRRVWLGLVAVLLVGAAATSLLALWANQARQEAIGQARLASAVKGFLGKDLLELGNPHEQAALKGAGVSIDADLRVRDLLVRASQRIEGRFADQPLVEEELRNIMGRALWRMGRSDLAVKHFERLRDLSHQLRGPDDPVSLSILHSLANAYDDLGKKREALELRQALLQKCQVRLGQEHPDTLSAMHNLAISYDGAGRREEALALREKVLHSRRTSLAPDDPDVFRSMNDLALSYEALGRRDEALKLHEDALRLRTNHLGPNHPDTIRSMGNLANCYDRAGRGKEAITLCEETLRLGREKLGPDHPDVLTSMSNLAVRYKGAGRIGEAVKLNEDALRLRRKTLGVDHGDALDSAFNLALSYDAAGRAADAFDLREDALPGFRTKFGADHAVTLSALASLAATGESLGRQGRVAAAFLACAEDLDGRGKEDVKSLYNSACLRSLAAAARAKAVGPDSMRLAGAQADLSMARLQKAITAGFSDLEHIKNDADLDALRGRDDFKRLLAELENQVKAAKSAKTAKTGT